MSTSRLTNVLDAVTDIPRTPGLILRHLAARLNRATPPQPSPDNPIAYLKAERVSMRVPYRVLGREVAHVTIRHEAGTYFVKFTVRTRESEWIEPRRMEDTIERLVAKGKPFSFTAVEERLISDPDRE